MWTDEDDKLLIQLWADGKPSTFIAKAMSLSRGAVMGRISRLRKAGVDLKARPRPPRKKRAYAPKPKPKPKPKVLELAAVVRPISVPATPFINAPEVAYGEPCDILSLRFFSCRYIVQEKPILYCNHMVHKHSYCEKHFDLCYQKGTNVPLKTKPKPMYRTA